MSVCEASWCRRRQNQRSLNFTFHSFPVRQPHLCWEWVKFTKKKLPWHPTAKSFLCSEHFEDNCFHCPDLRKTLKDDAVPTVILTKGNVVVLDKHNKSSKKAKAKNSSFHKHNESSKKAEAKNKSLHKHRKRKRKADTSVPGASPSQPAKSTDRGSHKEKISRSSKSPLKSNEPVIKRTSKNALHNVQPTDKAVKGTPGSEAALQQNKPGNMERAKENLRTIQPTEQSGLPQADVLIIAEIPKDTVHNVQPMEVEYGLVLTNDALPQSNGSVGRELPKEGHNLQQKAVQTAAENLPVTSNESPNKEMSNVNSHASQSSGLLEIDTPTSSRVPASKKLSREVVLEKIKTIKQKIQKRDKKIAAMKRLATMLDSSRTRPFFEYDSKFRQYLDDDGFMAKHKVERREFLMSKALNSVTTITSTTYIASLKKLALQVYFYSPKLYNRLYKYFNLPDVNTVKGWYSSAIAELRTE